MLRKFASWIIAIFAVVAANSANAQSNVTVQSDIIDPVHGKKYWTSDIIAFLEANDRIGFGLWTTFNENDYSKIKPYVSVAVANGFRLDLGYSSESTGNSYVFGGFEYFHAFTKSETMFLSSAYYRPLENGSDFVDSFLELKHDFGNGFALGLEVVYDRWPETKSNWLLVGPAIHYRINEKIELFARIAGESCIDNMIAVDSRIGLNISF